MFDRFSGTIVDLHPLLHDSWLRRVSSDPALKTACVAINNQSVNQHHGFDAEAEFELFFTSVGSLEILVAQKHGLFTDEHGKAQPLYRVESDRVPGSGVRKDRPRSIESGHRGFRRRLFLQK